MPEWLLDVDRGALERVMDGFDSGEVSPRWRSVDWEHPGRQKYAVQYQGRLFPPKEVVRRAIYQVWREWPEDRSRGNFAPKHANDYICSRGFSVIDL